MPLLSIITPTYNLYNAQRVETFQEAVASVMAQRFRAYEHIVIDGGSNDGTRELLEGARGEGRISSYLSSPDNGVYDAMNKGANAASGEYLMFLNSDDFYHDVDGLNRVSAAIHTGRPDFVCSPVRVLDGHSDSTMDVGRGFWRSLCRMPFGHPGLAVKATLFKELGGFNLSYSLAADYDFILRMLFTKARPSVLDEPFVTFRTGGLSGNKSVIQTEKMQIWRSAYARYARLSDGDLANIAVPGKFPLRLVMGLATSGGVPLRMRIAGMYQAYLNMRHA